MGIGLAGVSSRYAIRVPVSKRGGCDGGENLTGRTGPGLYGTDRATLGAKKPPRSLPHRNQFPRSVHSPLRHVAPSHQRPLRHLCLQGQEDPLRRLHQSPSPTNLCPRAKSRSGLFLPSHPAYLPLRVLPLRNIHPNVPRDVAL